MNSINSEKKFSTAGEKAYIIISEKILSGEFEPGRQLPKRKMAEITGVSVIPVIEALNRLEEDGLVESKPRWGSFVIVPTEEKIKDVYVLREAIECQIARILSQKLSPTQENTLRDMAYQLDNIKYTKETYKEFTKLHYEFHARMVEYCGYDSLISALRRINLFWILCKGASTRRKKSPSLQNWHTKLLNEIVKGDPDAAEAMMRIHVYDSLDAIIDTFQK